MNTVYPKRLKKLRVLDVENIRDLYRRGNSINYLSKRFKVSETSIRWHVGELLRPEYVNMV